MFSFLGTKPYRIDIALLIVRIWLGLAFIIFHGFRKITNPDGWEKLGATMANIGLDFAPVFWGFMAAFTESFGALFFITWVVYQTSCSFACVYYGNSYT